MNCILIPLIYINAMVHMFSLPSIYFLFSYVFLLLRLRSQSFFSHSYSYVSSLFSSSNIHFQILITLQSIQPLTSNLHLGICKQHSKNICSNPSPTRLCGFEITILVYSRATVSSESLSSLFVNSAPSVLLEVSLLSGSTSISRSPSLLKLQKMPLQLHSNSCLLCLRQSRTCLLKLQKRRSQLLACDGQRTRSKTTLNGAIEQTCLEVGFFHQIFGYYFDLVAKVQVL